MGIWLEIFSDIVSHDIVLLWLSVSLIILGVFFVKQLRIYDISTAAALCDPVVISVIFSELTAAIVPVFMYFYDWMYDETFFISYVLTEMALFIGIFLMKGRSSISSFHICIDKKIDISTYIRKKAYIIITSIYVLSKFMYFFSVGIPLFSDSYYTTLMSQSTFLARFNISLYLIVCMLWLDSFSYIKSKCNYIVGIIILGTFVLSAQKGLISYFLFAFFFIELYKLKRGKKTMVISRKVILLSLILILSFVMIQLVVQAMDHDEWNPLVMLIIRVMGNGDSFPIFYGMGQTAGILQEHTGISEFIVANLSVFKIDFGYNSDYIPNNELAAILSSAVSEFVSPVIKHNIIGIKIFGLYFSWIYSLFIGLAIGFISRCLYRRMININFFVYIIYCDIYVGVTNCLSNYIISGYFDSVFINGFLLLIIYVIFHNPHVTFFKAEGDRS